MTQNSPADSEDTQTTNGKTKPSNHLFFLKKPFTLKKATLPLTAWVFSTLKYVVVFILIYTAINWWRQPVMPANPDLQLTDYQGNMIDIESMSHKTPVLVYFWGRWCSVCQVTSPKVNALAHASPYPVITIATQSGSNDDLKTYMTAKGLSFITINDESGELFHSWQGQVTPSYVVLKDGEMKQGLTGIQPQWSLRLRLWLSSLG